MKNKEDNERNEGVLPMNKSTYMKLSDAAVALAGAAYSVEIMNGEAPAFAATNKHTTRHRAVEREGFISKKCGREEKERGGRVLGLFFAIINCKHYKQ